MTERRERTGSVAKPRRRRAADSGSSDLASDLPERIQVERSVTTLGFFSVRSGIPEDGSLERTIEIDRRTDQGRVRARATIAVHKSSGGFPGVEEQDVYYAILSAIGEAIAAGEEIRMPLTFAPGELLRRMGKEAGGPNYRALARQLKRLAGATIISDAAVYRAETNEWVSSTEEMFRIIDRVVIKGERGADGKLAHEHQIWLSSWQLENLRRRHRLIVDYQRYLLLKKPIARALVPYLQLWLYASRGEGRCERLYEPLCRLLGIKVERHPSQIKKQLEKPLAELIDAGYLTRWAVDVAGGVFSKRYKIVFFHGPAFADEPELLDEPERAGEADGARILDDAEAAEYVALLRARGVWPREAAKLARRLTRDGWERALRVVEYVSAKADRGEIDKPGAFLAALLRADRESPVTLGASERAMPAAEVTAAGADPVWEDDVTRRAVAELEAFRAFEAETDEIMRSLAPLEKAEIYELALGVLERDFPQSQRWDAKVRDRQKDVIFRRLVRERY